MARGAGVALLTAGAPPVPAEAAAVVLDCNEGGGARVALIAGLVAESPDRPVLAVLPHRDQATRRAALAAGARRCIPNSALETVLPRLLGRAGAATPAAAGRSGDLSHGR